ncbi:PPOX class F420-dependent oxidoreductase [Glaciibacter flavus]|uniref:PPOX class F420-dependent oxidoreductase n=1 Tax=Orlajensenia flava TaxID=2565934 RepID=A0A4S4FTU6_9MICO|nr:PPOX class F420-dependent oxidoreductase [Glaciibacter flavus]THG33854.1 PPOX class F420-dependent oxidoreductase [Glaciibacter flavus]
MSAPTFRSLGDEAFVSLTTFRRSGEPVSTPVWIAPDGDALAVRTTAATGKVKRLRNSSRAQLRPSTRSGKVDPAVEPVEVVAEVLMDPAELQRLTPNFVRKYGVQYRIFMLIERLFANKQRQVVVLHIKPASPTAG